MTQKRCRANVWALSGGAWRTGALWKIACALTPLMPKELVPENEENCQNKTIVGRDLKPGYMNVSCVGV